MTDKEQPKPVTHDQVSETFAVPTVVVNRFLVTTNPDRVRIVFGESYSPDHATFHRVAVQLTPWEADELRVVLEELLKPFQPVFDEAKAKFDGPDGK